MKTIKYKNTDEQIYYEKLSNGLEVYMYPKDTAKNFYLAFNVKFGSIDTEFKCGKEKKYTSVPYGTAHFLEHQMFEEDDGKSAFEYFSKLGSSVNAFTTYDYTSYEVVASTNFKENLEYLLDYVQNPVFKTNNVNKERGIIKEEIKMYDNTPMSVLYFELEKNLNNVDNHKYKISGEEEDIKEITPDTLNRCYEAFYHPSNMFLVLTGKFSPLEALGIIKANQSRKTFKNRPKVQKSQEKEQLEVALDYEEIYMDVSIPKVKVAYKLDKNKFKDIDSVVLKTYINSILELKFGETSDLLEKLTEEHIVLWPVFATCEIREDYILVAIEAETEYKEQFLDLVRTELDNLKVSKDELERIKKINKANFLLHFDDVVAVAQSIEDDIVGQSKIVDDIMEIYDALDLKKMNVICDLINAENECIYFIDKTV